MFAGPYPVAVILIIMSIRHLIKITVRGRSTAQLVVFTFYYDSNSNATKTFIKIGTSSARWSSIKSVVPGIRANQLFTAFSDQCIVQAKIRYFLALRFYNKKNNTFLYSAGKTAVTGYLKISSDCCFLLQISYFYRLFSPPNFRKGWHSHLTTQRNV